jgi:hypothetical protein
MEKTAGSFRLGAMASRRASVLIVALGVLTVLALLAFVFTSLSRVERDVAKSYVDQTKAKMLAQAGIEKACLEIREIAFTQSWEDLTGAWAYRRFADSNGNGRFDLGEPLLPAGAPQYDYSELDLCAQPSFCDGRVTIEAQPRGYSGRLASSYPDVSPVLKSVDAYALKVIDCASQIYINGPVGYLNGNPLNTLATNVVRMLNQLGVELGVANLGTRISTNRPIGGYALKSQLAAPGILGLTDYNRVKDYITAHAWVDMKTLNPDGIEPTRDNGTDMVNPNNKWVMDKANRTYAGCGAADHFNAGQNQYNPNMTETEPPNPAGSGQPTQQIVQPRAPININTASRAVLVAVLYDIRGGYINRAARNSVRPGAFVRTTLAPAVAPLNTGVDLTTARSFADAIIAYRATTPFKSQDQFAAFVNSQGFSVQLKNLIKANANPNSDIRDMNYNKAHGYNAANTAYSLRFADIDKADLKQWTTEFCFSSMGYFNIESMGTVTAGDKIMAQSKITTVAKVYDVIRHTTQYDFRACATNLNNVSTFPDHLDNFTTWQTEVVAGRGRYSDIDGNVQITPYHENAGGQVLFRADFSNDLDAEEGTGSTDLGMQPASGHVSSSSASNRSAYGPANDGDVYGAAPRGISAFDFGDPSELRPDGVFCDETNRSMYILTSDSYGAYRYGSANSQLGNDWDEYLRYQSGGNLPSQGTLEMWFKPTWNTATEGGVDINDSRVFFSCGANTEGWRYPSNFTVKDRFIIFYRAGRVNFYVGNNVDGTNAYFNRALNYPDRYVAIRGSYAPTNTIFFGKCSVPVSWQAGEWHHLVAVWESTRAWLYIDGVKCANILDRLDAMDGGGYWTGGKTGWAMHIGHNRFLRNHTNAYPMNIDATIDGIRIFSSTTKYPENGFPPIDRYRPNRDGVLTMGLFPTTGSGPGLSGRLGSLTWTRFLPADCPSAPYPNNAITIRVDTGLGTATATGDGSGFSLNGMAFSNINNVQYVITLAPPNRTPCVETPILDDITLTYATGETKYFFWSIE